MFFNLILIVYKFPEGALRLIFKRITFTPFISADGKMFMQHVLFSKLKNPPKLADKRCIVDSNVTGMWSEALIKKTIDLAIASKQTPFNRNLKLLFILDSYLTHVKFACKSVKNTLRKTFSLQLSHKT